MLNVLKLCYLFNEQHKSNLSTEFNLEQANVCLNKSKLMQNCAKDEQNLHNCERLLLDGI